ncbi:MAG: DUF4145 domain-containing protein [Crenarchaeota archaeon]|nr:MAG: DUF4145 domain-containing protein [Thermoproteota archaeon]
MENGYFVVNYVKLMNVDNNCVTGFGIFFYPFVFINDKPGILPRAPPKKSGRSYRNIVIKRKFKDHVTLVTDDGFVAVISDDKKKTLNYINLIFATSILHSIHYAKQATSPDLGHVIFHKNLNQIEFNALKLTERNYIALDRDEGGRYGRIAHAFPRNWISIERMNFVLNRANKYKKNTKLVNRLILLAEGWSHIYELSPSAGFMFCWVFIENFIDEFWKKHIATLSRTKVETDALAGFVSWTAYNKIEVLSQVGKIPDSSRKVIDEMRKKRNSFVHDWKQITQKDAVRCFGIAAYILLNQFERKNPFSDLERINQIPD